MEALLCSSADEERRPRGIWEMSSGAGPCSVVSTSKTHTHARTPSATLARTHAHTHTISGTLVKAVVAGGGRSEVGDRMGGPQRRKVEG